MFLNWWRNAGERKAKPSARPPRRPGLPARSRPPSVPLSLEVMERRTLLAADTWINPNGGAWDAGSNWDLGNPPGAGDTALISTAAAATITIQSGDDVRVQGVTVGSNDTLAVAGGSLT